jgi:hypothetical protein
MKINYKTYLISIVLLICFFNLKGFSQSVGVNSVTITFDNPPTEVNISKSPLRYNKDFALSYILDDGLKDAYSHAFKFLNGGTIGSETYPGLYYTDGCGNDVNFTMNTALFSINNNNDAHESGTDNAKIYITWPEIIEMYQNGWGVINHGITSSKNIDPNYSIARNESYIRKRTINDIEGGIKTKIFVCPNGSKNFLQPAFSQDYLVSFYGTGNGVPYFDVTNKTFNLGDDLEMGRFVAQKNTIITDLTTQLNNESSDTKKLWAASLSHKVTDRNNGYNFSDFVGYMQNIESNYGKSGSDKIWMASVDEILEYLILKDLIEIKTSQNGNQYTLSFSGNLPTDFRFYALSLNISADANITNIEINGGSNCTQKIENNIALINLNWDGRVIENAENLAEYYVGIAEVSQKEYDVLIAMDYVSMMDDGSKIKSIYASRLCNIEGVSLPDEFCNCGTQEKYETTICPGTSIELTAPDGDLYIWNTGETTQTIEVNPNDSTTYFVNVFTDDVCSGNKSFRINTYPTGFAKAGHDVSICIPECINLTAQGGNSYLWSTGETSQTIEVCPDASTNYIVEVTNNEGCIENDTVYVTANKRLPLNLPKETTIYYGDYLTLKADNTNDCVWNTGETSSEIIVSPKRNTIYTLTDTDNNNCSIAESTQVILSHKINTTTDYLAALKSVAINPVSSIIITFESNPGFATATKTLLRYNKEFALSFHIKNGNKSLYSHAFPYLNGGSISGTNYPGLKYTDGCGNDVNFKMGTSISSFNADSIGVHDPSNGYGDDYLSWNEIIELYEEDWGIFSQGFVQDSTKIPSYNIARNHSYVKYKTFETIPGGIPMNIIMNPKGDTAFSTPAFDQNYRAAFASYTKGIQYYDIGLISNSDSLKMGSNSMDSQQSLSALADLVHNNYNSNTRLWTSANVSTITDGSAIGYSFDIFRFHMTHIANTYGTGGLDNIWMAPEEEVWDYLIVNNKSNLATELRGNQFLITFSGDIPTNLNHYALSLLIESDATISNIEVNGGGGFTSQIKQDTSALINLEWNGKELVADTVIAKYHVELAETNKTTQDALVALDYVNMLDSELALKKDLKDRLCDISGVNLPSGYCSCEFSIGNDISICYGECVTLIAPEGNSYLWNTAEDTQSIEVCPESTSSYYVTATNQFDCFYTDTIKVMVDPPLSIQTSNDTIICPGETVKLWVKGGTSYLWDTGETNDTITVNPTEATKYYVTSYSANDCGTLDSIFVDMHFLPNANAGIDQAICPGNCADLTATGGYAYKWNTGEETNSIEVCPDKDNTEYIVTVYSEHNCPVNDTVMVTFNPIPTITVSNDISKCISDCVDLSVSGAIAYTWSTGETTETIEVCPTTETKYYVTGKNQFGCAAIDSVTVSIDGIEDVSLLGVLPVYCENDSPVILDGSPTNGTFGGPGVTDNIFSPAIASPGVHQIYYTVTDNKGCTSTDTVDVHIYENPKISLGRDTTLCTDESLEIFNPAGYDSYYWSNGNEGNYIKVDINNFQLGITNLSLTATNDGCVTKDEVVITFESCNVGIEDLEEIGINLYPNPNSGIFNITYDGTESNLHFSIFNIQGQEIYSEELNDCSDSMCIKEINVSFLKKGMYVIRFYSEKGIRSGKISIQ